MKTTKKDEVSVYMIFKNHAGSITEECLIGIFRNEKWAEWFVENGNINEGNSKYRYLEMRKGV